MKINPILKKDLGIKARTMKFTWIVVGYNVIIGIVALLLMIDALGFSKEWGYTSFSKMALMYQNMAVTEMLLLLVIIPSITGASIAGEREKRTLDLLLTSKLTSWQIISGKLQTCVALMMLLVITSLPLLSLSIIFGGIGIWN
ncbi:MAG TPA: ABC transporter permease, partial [Candidatus Merdenecus merdavium]|nr:ABC transporter permease [Candidatus Merdenecus merdavium]